MKRQKMFQQVFAALAALMLVITFTLFPQPPSLASPAKDYVIVIDVSTSMQDIFDEVKKIADRTIKEAKVGDTIAVITFGDSATLIYRRQIRAQADIDDLQKQIDALYPTDYSTYLNGGLEKSLSELKYLFEKHPDRQRVLLWLSDDKDNPPTVLGKDVLTLDKLREENKNFEPGREWFTYDAPLTEVKNEHFQDFITWARRTTFRVGIREDTLNLGSFENGDVDKKITLTFEPKHPGAAGLEFATEARLVDPKDPTHSVPVRLSPDHIVASGHMWQQQFEVAFKGEPGEYKGELFFKSLSGPMLDVEPNKVVFTAMIIPPKLPEVAEPAAPAKPEGPAQATERGAGIIAKEARPPGMERPEKPLTFGPLEPGKKDNKIITLFLNKEADAKSIKQDLSIQLPPGVNIQSKVYGRRGVELAAEIIASVDQDAQLPEDVVMRGAYEGTVRFKSNEAGVEVLPLNIPIRIEMNTDKVRWGKKLLPDTSIGRLKAKNMSFEELTKELATGEETKTPSPIVAALHSTYSKVASRYVLLPVLAAVILLFVVLIYRMRPPSELFVGELVVIKDPSDTKMKNANLKRIGSLHGKDVLTLGSSPTADIRLNHASISPIHCKLSARKNEEQIEISIVPIKGCSVKVNDVECVEKARLSDKDLIGIGEFILLFSNPEAQKEVVAHLLNGQTVKGTPVTWDIGATSFELLRSDIADVEETAEEITVVNFSDLKAVFFTQDASVSRPGIPKDRINTHQIFQVTFFDGEQIEGHPLTDYTDAAGRFYLVPREMPNILSILIERNSVKELTKREFRGEAEATRSAGILGTRRAARKGTASAE